MYRHPNNGMGPNGNRNQNNNNQNNGQGYNNAHPWYPGGYPQPSPMGPPPVPYLPTQEEQQMWHHHHHVHPTGHAVFQHEYPEFVHHHAGIPAMPHVIPVQHYVPAPQNNVQSGHPQVPSPTVTGSNSDASSPERPSSSMTASVATVVAPPRQSPQTMLGHQVHHQQPHPYQHNVQNRPPPARSPYEWIKKTSYNVQPNPGKTRTKDKYRVVYTDHQRMELEKEFTFNNKYITIRRKSELALNLGLSERQIKIWFQNRRAKERKQNKKRIEEKSHMDHIHNGYTQGMLPQLPQLQSMDLQNQQNVLSNMMNGNAAIQRYMENENPNMKMEENEEDQIG